MYQNPHFTTAGDAEVVAFMRANPFITLCGISADGKPVATHVPVLLEEREGRLFLQGHVKKKQEHTLAFQQHSQVLAIFTGPHAYVSASWYEDPGKAATWNYQAVHAEGILKMLDDQALHRLLEKLTRHFEGREDSPSLVTRMDPEYLQQTMRAILAFEVELTTIAHVFKLSQNKSREDYERVITHLEKDGGDGTQLAEVMKTNQKKLFDRE